MGKFVQDAKSAKNQTESRLTSLDLNLKMLCFAVDKILCEVCVHFVLYINMKRRLVHVFELRQYSDMSRHIKEPQNSIYCLNLHKNYKINSGES